MIEDQIITMVSQRDGVRGRALELSVNLLLPLDRMVGLVTGRDAGELYEWVRCHVVVVA